ncbi:MAG: glycosyltransferase family 25 protein [Verrucomicrobia bacterium]|nr:glycosyltransferase family 25 protein [Verrucomicrobiota bacterium]
MKIRYWFAIIAALVSAYLFFMNSDGLGNSQKPELSTLIKPLEVTPYQTGIAGIDCIYCINLDVRKEKWVSMEQRLSLQGMKANRVSAINGWKDIPHEQVRKIKKPLKAKLNRGRIGCLLSHLSVMHDAKNRNLDRILVLEDDVNFISDMKNISSYLDKLSTLDPQWDILFLDDWNLVKIIGDRPPADRPGSKMSQIIKKPKEIVEGTDFVRTYYRHGAYAMIISKKGIKKICDYFDQTHVFCAYDLEFNHIENIRMYETNKDFVSVNLDISDTSKKPKLLPSKQKLPAGAGKVKPV